MASNIASPTKPLWYGYGPPFVGGATNIMSPQTNEQLIKNDIMCLLLTLPGERIYRPEFGCELRNYTFELADDADLDDLRRSISEAIQQWEPRVSVSRVDLALDQSNQLLTVVAAVTPNSNPLQTYTIQVNIPASGGTQSI